MKKMGKNQLTINYSDNDILISRGETKPKNFLFRLHNHEDYEIYIFISGDVIYNIEGRDYKLTPYDMLFVRPDEMHRVFHVNENSTYKRMIINITDNFFSQNGIEDFKARLIERSMSEDRKISNMPTSPTAIRILGEHNFNMYLLKTSFIYNINLKIFCRFAQSIYNSFFLTIGIYDNLINYYAAIFPFIR